MIQDAVFKEPQPSDESPNCRMVNHFGHAAPVVQRLFDDPAITIVVDHFQLCSQHIQNTQYFVQGQDLLKTILLIIRQVLFVFKQQITTAFKNLLFLVGGLEVFLRRTASMTLPKAWTTWKKSKTI